MSQTKVKRGRETIHEPPLEITFKGTETTKFSRRRIPKSPQSTETTTITLDGTLEVTGKSTRRHPLTNVAWQSAGTAMLIITRFGRKIH